MKNTPNCAKKNKPSSRLSQGLTNDSVAEAFLLAKFLYGGSDSPLVFTKRAEEAALKSPFLRPQEVFDCLEQLWFFANRLRENKGALGKPYYAYFAERGLSSYRPAISQTAFGRFRGDYTTKHGGRVYGCEHHFTLGAKCANTCLSIHFDIDSQTRRVLITYCGRHLKNTQS